MRFRLLLALLMLLAAAEIAKAQTPPPAQPAPAAAECSEEESSRRAMDALRRAVEDPLPGEAGDTVPVRFTPCGPGRVLLRVHHGTMKGPLIATGERTLRSTRTATVWLRMTRNVERLRGSKPRFRLRARFTPAAG
jgi:hypothetical protein